MQKNNTVNSKKSQNTRLALDIGTNSIGWALYTLDKNKKPCLIKGAGVRIFSSGRKEKDYTTLNATRRQARLQRRQRDRYLQRRSYLIYLLKQHGLFPKDVDSTKKLQSLNPYKLRAEGLDVKLDIYHFGRALFHLNQRRGFKSNRKSSRDKETGLIKQSIKASKELMQKYSSRTYGEFLWHRFQKMEQSRKKPGSQQENWVLARRAIGAGTKDNYAVYAQRDMLKKEFNNLWDKQAEFYDKLKNQNLKDTFSKAIFSQRPLKKPIVGQCELMPNEKRISKALPSFQKFRILKELNNLSHINSRGKSDFISKMKKGKEFRDSIIQKHFYQKNKVTFSVLEKEFKNYFPHIEGDFVRFNLEIENKQYLEGDHTGYLLKKIIPDWSNWPLGIQDQFVEWLEEGDPETDLEKNKFMKEDEEIRKDLENFNKRTNLNLSAIQIEECLKMCPRLPSGHARYSKKAITRILPFLEEGQREFTALKSAFPLTHSEKHTNLQNKLPKYETVLKNHCVPMRGRKGDENRIPNPTVHIALNQVRLLVNDIIRVYGKPLQVVVETARDLPLGRNGIRELEKKQRENKERNDTAREAIEEFNQQSNRDNLIRYKLWEEQKKTCIYSGKKIPKSKLFSEALEVDHILPWSRTLDDSFMNKVLVYRNSNRQKSNQTPFEYFSSQAENWEEILQRAGDLSNGKKWRFHKNAIERFQEEGGFLERQLNDTRYISKYAKEYLKLIAKEVWTVRGQTTSIFRKLLKDEKKDRSDHRSHAKDALVIGLIDRAFIQHISKIAKKIEKTHKNRLENIGKAITKNILPWPSFKADAKQAINTIIVSHRKRTKKEGCLHNATAYGLIGESQNFNNPISVIHYEKDILSLKDAKQKKIDKIISQNIQADFRAELKKNDSLSQDFLIHYHQKTGIRRVRLKEKETVIPIKDGKSQKIYKAFKGDSNYAIKLCQNEKNQWMAEVISTFKANQNFQPIPKNIKLMKGDMLFFENRFWRLVKFDKNNRLKFLEHFVAGTPKNLSKDRETKDLYRDKTINTLQKIHPQRVDISPCGKVTLTAFKLPIIKADKKDL